MVKKTEKILFIFFKFAYRIFFQIFEVFDAQNGA